MKRFSIFSFAALLALAGGRVIPEIPADALQDLPELSSFPALSVDHGSPKFDGALLNVSHSERLTVPFLGPGNPRGSFPWVPPPPASDKEWDDATCKGLKLHDSMLGSDHTAGQLFKPPRQSAQSTFSSTGNEIDTFKYDIYDPTLLDPNYGNFDEFWGIGNALRFLSVSDKPVSQGGRNILLFLRHGTFEEDEHGNPNEPPYIVDGKTYRVKMDANMKRKTGAYFAYSMNPEDGVIMAMNRKGPKHAAHDRIPPVPEDQIPPFYQSSDISWALWQQYARPNNLKNIKSYFTLFISNPLTQRLIVRALNAQNAQLGPFPGTEFWTNFPEGQALLASPNGVGMAYFLIQHKNELGSKYIEDVYVFSCDNALRNVCAMFAIGDNPSPPPDGSQNGSPPAGFHNESSFPSPSKPEKSGKGTEIKRDWFIT